MSIQSSIPCIYNCLIPIGLADPSGCDVVDNDCACLSAPSGAQELITDCINTVCETSTSLYASMATSLYQSYCNGAYSADRLSSAISAESVSNAQVAASSTTTSNSTTASATTSASATATSKSEAGVWQPSLYVSRHFHSKPSASNNGTGTPQAEQFSDSFCSASSNVTEQQVLQGSVVIHGVGVMQYSSLASADILGSSATSFVNIPIQTESIQNQSWLFNCCLAILLSADPKFPFGGPLVQFSQHRTKVLYYQYSYCSQIYVWISTERCGYY
jgi:hypothetical protein